MLKPRAIEESRGSHQAAAPRLLGAVKQQLARSQVSPAPRSELKEEIPLARPDFQKSTRPLPSAQHPTFSKGLSCLNHFST